MSHSIDLIWGAITLPFTKCNVGQHCNPRESRLYRLFQRHKKRDSTVGFWATIQPPARGTWLNVSLAESGSDNLFVCLRWNSWLSRTYIVSVTNSPWIMSSLSRTRAEDATCHVLGPPATTPSTWKYTHQGSVSTILLARWLLLLCSAVCFFFSCTKHKEPLKSKSTLSTGLDWHPVELYFFCQCVKGKKETLATQKWMCGTCSYDPNLPLLCVQPLQPVAVVVFCADIRRTSW